MTHCATEIWRPVPRFNGVIEASSLGRIRRVKQAQDAHGVERDEYIYNQRPHYKKEYLLVQFQIAGKNYTCFPHSLICEAFHGPRPPGYQAAHRNGIRTDNRENNLRWLTARDNVLEQIKHGTAIWLRRKPLLDPLEM